MATLSPQKLQRLRNTWVQVITHSKQAGEIFYTNLFDLAPELIPLFQEDIKKQDQKLLSAITVIITELDRLDNLHEELRALAKRHIK